MTLRRSIFCTPFKLVTSYLIYLRKAISPVRLLGLFWDKFCLLRNLTKPSLCPIEFGLFNAGRLETKIHHLCRSPTGGERIENPRFLRKSAEKLARLQAKLADRVKGSKPWKIIKGKISKLHQFVARSRLDFQFKAAHNLFGKCDVLY
ncbi:MAG: transposase [Microcoleus sp.]